MDPLALKVAARYAGPVVPFQRKPNKPNVPTVEIGGKHYALSTDGGPLGDASDPNDHGIFGYGESEEEGHARLIKGPEREDKWRYLWAYDTEHQQLGMWRVKDGNEKHFGSAHSEQARIVSLDKRGELNRVTHSEIETITREMRRREGELEADLKKYIEENKTEFDRKVDKLAEEYFEHHVKAKLERAIEDVKRGATPLGFKPFGPGAHDEHARFRQLMSYVVGQTFSREMSREKFTDYVRQKGLDPDTDLQTVHWAVDDVLEKVYARYLPPYER